MSDACSAYLYSYCGRGIHLETTSAPLFISLLQRKQPKVIIVHVIFIHICNFVTVMNAQCAHLPKSNRSGAHSSFGRIIFMINVSQSNHMMHASENNLFLSCD